MICKICNKDYRALGSHISKSHNMDIKTYYDTYIKTSTDGFCKTCGKPTAFVNLHIGYKNHCSNSCAQKDKSTREKIRKTNLERYGYTNGNRELVKKTNLERYGSTSYLSTKECRKALRKANQELYGTNTPFESKEIQEKVKQTNRKNLGVDYPLANKQVHEKAQQNKLNDIYNYAKANNMELLINLTESYGWGWLYELDIPYVIYKHVALVDNKYLPSIQEYAKNHPNIPKVSKRHKYNSGGKVKSKAELVLIDYIKSIYNGTIDVGSYKIISPYQLDIYLPDLKLAIEYNGIYWHSIKHKPKHYHQKKSLLCKDKDIRLIHIYEFEDINVAKKLIYNAINGLETIDFSKPCSLDKDNWKLYEKEHKPIKILKPTKLLEYPEVYNAGAIIYD